MRRILVPLLALFAGQASAPIAGWVGTSLFWNSFSVDDLILPTLVSPRARTPSVACVSSVSSVCAQPPDPRSPYSFLPPKCLFI